MPLTLAGGCRNGRVSARSRSWALAGEVALPPPLPPSIRVLPWCSGTRSSCRGSTSGNCSWGAAGAAGECTGGLLWGRLLRERKDQQGAAALASRSGAGAARAGRWEEEMAKDGRVDIFGSALHRWLYDSGGGPAPDGLLAGHAR